MLFIYVCIYVCIQVWIHAFWCPQRQEEEAVVTSDCEPPICVALQSSQKVARHNLYDISPTTARFIFNDIWLVNFDPDVPWYLHLSLSLESYLFPRLRFTIPYIFNSIIKLKNLHACSLKSLPHPHYCSFLTQL